MLRTLPVTMVYSFLLWAAIIYTILGCIQLVLFESTLKKEYPKAATYRTMSPEHKKNVHKILMKVGFGLLGLIALAVLDRLIILK